MRKAYKRMQLAVDVHAMARSLATCSASDHMQLHQTDCKLMARPVMLSRSYSTNGRDKKQATEIRLWSVSVLGPLLLKSFHLNLFTNGGRGQSPAR